MGQPVKLSDDLVIDARMVGKAMKRPIAGQVEFWARLGSALEPLLKGTTAIALARRGGTRPLSKCLADVGTAAGRRRLSAALAAQPFPHYVADPDQAGVLIRIEESGRRTRGRFVNRVFKALHARARR